MSSASAGQPRHHMGDANGGALVTLDERRRRHPPRPPGPGRRGGRRHHRRIPPAESASRPAPPWSRCRPSAPDGAGRRPRPPPRPPPRAIPAGAAQGGPAGSSATRLDAGAARRLVGGRRRHERGPARHAGFAEHREDAAGMSYQLSTVGAWRIDSWPAGTYMRPPSFRPGVEHDGDLEVLGRGGRPAPGQGQASDRGHPSGAAEPAAGSADGGEVAEASVDGPERHRPRGPGAGRSAPSIPSPSRMRLRSGPWPRRAPPGTGRRRGCSRESEQLVACPVYTARARSVVRSRGR